MAAAQAYIPIVTIEAIASDAQKKVSDKIGETITHIEAQLESLKALKSDDSIRKELVQKYAQIPTMIPDPAGGGGTIMGLKKLAGMGGKEMDIGAIFAKYYGLAKLAEEVMNAGKDGRNANIPAVEESKRVMAGRDSKDVYASAIQQSDELLQKIAAAKEYEEVRYMQVFSKVLLDVEKDCQKIRSTLFKHMNDIYAPNRQISYPELSESFRGREVSYQIEPSGVQGAGRETRFLFQDFLKSRGVDEESD